MKRLILKLLLSNSELQERSFVYSIPKSMWKVVYKSTFFKNKKLQFSVTWYYFKHHQGIPTEEQIMEACVTNWIKLEFKESFTVYRYEHLRNKH